MPFFGEAVTAGLQSASLPTPPIFSAVVRDAFYCTGNNVLLRSPRRMVAESYEAWERSGPCSTFRTPFDSRLCHQTPEPGVLTGTTTTFRSIRTSYYHTLVDNIPRIALLHHDRYRNVGHIEVLINGTLNRAEKYLLDLLLPDNCSIRTLRDRAVYRVEEFILLSHLTYQFAGVASPTVRGFLS